MKNNWVGAIMSFLFVCMFITIVIQVCIILQLKQEYGGIQAMYKETVEKVNEHDKIMKAYEFFNKTWERLYNEEKKEE